MRHPLFQRIFFFIKPFIANAFNPNTYEGIVPGDPDILLLVSFRVLLTGIFRVLLTGTCIGN